MTTTASIFAHEWGESQEWAQSIRADFAQLKCKHCDNYVHVPDMRNECPARALKAARDANLNRLEKIYVKTACSVCGEVFTGLVHDCPQRNVPERIRGMIGGIAEGLYSVSHTERCKTICRLVSEVLDGVDRRIAESKPTTEALYQLIHDIADERIGKARVEFESGQIDESTKSWVEKDWAPVINMRIVPGDKA